MTNCSYVDQTKSSDFCKDIISPRHKYFLIGFVMTRLYLAKNDTIGILFMWPDDSWMWARQKGPTSRKMLNAREVLWADEIRDKLEYAEIERPCNTFHDNLSEGKSNWIGKKIWCIFFFYLVSSKSINMFGERWEMRFFYRTIAYNCLLMLSTNMTQFLKSLMCNLNLRSIYSLDIATPTPSIPWTSI